MKDIKTNPTEKAVEKLRGVMLPRVSLRLLVVLVVFAVIAALVTLLAVAMARSGGRPGGALTNFKPGEVSFQAKPAKNFTLELLDGRTLTLSDLTGKVVMVDFWASWCPPCRQEIPDLVQVYQEYRDRGVEFVGVDIWDTTKGAQRFISQYGVTYPSGVDEESVIAIDYGVTGIPEKYFLDRDGNIAAKFIGPITAERLRTYLERLLVQ